MKLKIALRGFSKQFCNKMNKLSEKIDSDVAWSKVSFVLVHDSTRDALHLSILKNHLLWSLALHLEVLEVEEPEPVSRDSGQAGGGKEIYFWKLGNERNLRMRKRARGALSPDIDPYSRETKEISIDKPIRMSRYLRYDNCQILKIMGCQPLHPKISVILDLGEHVDVDDYPEKAGWNEFIYNFLFWMTTLTIREMIWCGLQPEDHPHPPDDQPIELEAPLARGKRGQTKLDLKNVTQQSFQMNLIQANPIPNPGLQNDSFKSAKAVKRELFFLLLQKIGKVLSRKAKPKVDFNTSPLKNNINIFCTVKRISSLIFCQTVRKLSIPKKLNPVSPSHIFFFR